MHLEQRVKEKKVQAADWNMNAHWRFYNGNFQRRFEMRFLSGFCLGGFAICIQKRGCLKNAFRPDWKSMRDFIEGE